MPNPRVPEKTIPAPPHTSVCSDSSFHVHDFASCSSSSDNNAGATAAPDATAAAARPEQALPQAQVCHGPSPLPCAAAILVEEEEEMVADGDLPWDDMDWKDLGRSPASLARQSQRQQQPSPPPLQQQQQAAAANNNDTVTSMASENDNSILAQARQQFEDYMEYKNGRTTLQQRSQRIDDNNTDQEDIDPMAGEILAVAMSGRYSLPSTQQQTAITFATTAAVASPAPDKTVDIRGQLKAAMDGTQHYPGDMPLPMKRANSFLTGVLGNKSRTKVSVMSTTTIQAALSLAQRPDYTEQEEFRLGILNYAGALQPGGGFLWGAKSQEASLSLTTLLYPCLQARVNIPDEYYARNAAAPKGLYTDCAIVSPDVPIVRADAASWLEDPASATIVSIPAPNRSAASDPKECDAALERRIQRALDLFALWNCTHIVLGSYGCGVYGNDPDMVAKHFRKGLRRHKFQHVVFSILARNPKEVKNLQIFEHTFRSGML